VPRGQPVAPNVPRIVVVGIALSLATVVGGVGVAERMDTSFHTLDDLRSFTRLPVLASVPRFVTSTEKRRELRRTRRFFAMVLLIVAFIFVGSAYLSRGNQVFT
jgi:hypothetical protein